MTKGGRLRPHDEDYFMGKLFIDAAYCGDPEIQKAAMIVDGKGHICSHGFNILLKDYPSSNNGSWQDRDFALYSAEEVALDRALKKNFDSVTAAMYVLNPPSWRACLRCLSVGIKKINYLMINASIVDQEDWQKVQTLVKEKRGLEVKSFNGNLNWIRDRIMKYDYLF